MRYAQMAHNSKYGTLKTPLAGLDCTCVSGHSHRTGVNFHHNLLQWQIVFLACIDVN